MYLALHKVNLLIFDECHHSKGNNVYAVLMNEHYGSCHEPPRILGLTASITAAKIKPAKLLEVSKQLEATFR